jgi:hypothetical protein
MPSSQFGFDHNPVRAPQRRLIQAPITSTIRDLARPALISPQSFLGASKLRCMNLCPRVMEVLSPLERCLNSSGPQFVQRRKARRKLAASSNPNAYVMSSMVKSVSRRCLIATCILDSSTMIAIRIAPDMRMAVVGTPSYFAKRSAPKKS